MATRSIRPRVLTAVHNLRTFTISELCQVAGLTNRDQAYTQLKKLRDEGFVKQRTLPSGGDAHAPIKEYTLLSDPVTEKRFALELASYQLSRLVRTELGMAKVALREAEAGLDHIESSLKELEHDRSDNALNRPTELDTDFSTAWANIETAKLEYSSGDVRAEKTLPLSVRKIEERWKQANAKRDGFREELENRPAKIDWAPMLRTAAETVSRCIPLHQAVIDSVACVATLKNVLFQNCAEEYRAPIEVLLDEIRANHEYPFEPVFRHALRTKNSKVLFDVIQIFKHVDLAWWRYNLENTSYLKTSMLHAKAWLMAYEALRAQIPTQKETHFVVYSYALERLTRDVYLNVTRDRSVSLVSPKEIEFLGESEIVKPTLLIKNGSILKSLDCTFLSPNDRFHAYGPIANDVMLWQGAPDLRVVACLGMWGLPVEKNLAKIIKPLKNDRGLLVMQGEKPRLTSDAAEALEAKEIVEHVAR